MIDFDDRHALGPCGAAAQEAVEAGADYVDNMQRLLKKFETAKELVPAPILRKAPGEARFGVIYYGSTAPAMDGSCMRRS